MSTGKRIHDGDSYRTIMRSTDGAITWTSVDHGSTVNDNAVCMAYNGVDTWAMGHQSNVWTSTNDGVGWTDRGALEGTKDIYGICYDGDDTWIAVLQSSNIYYSTNDWVANDESDLSGQGNQYGCVYMKGTVNKFIAVSSAGQINLSPDGAEWTEATDYDDSKQLFAIATDHTTVIAVGNQGVIMTSADGNTWTIREISGTPDEQLRGIACNILRGIACNIIGAGLR